MTLAARLAALLGTPVRTVTDLGPSHAWTLHRAELSDGRTVFVKAATEHAPVLAAEAAGLRWLADGTADNDRTALGATENGARREATEGHRGTVGAEESSRGASESAGSAGLLPQAPAVDRGGLVPAVVAAEQGLLVLPWLPEATPTPAAAERFGRELAALHAHSPARFGAPWPGWIAELPLDNTVRPGPWAQWYAERRLAPYLPGAAAVLGRDGIRLLERVIDRIDALAGPPEPPARLHGDLWSGNLRWTPDRVMLIDPAAHGGHRETDLAMLSLFGAPHLDRILAAYHETHPLADGWRARVPLHQLHPLLVHVVLFGGGYANQTLTAATTLLT
ncbi:fructosamine kinase family protein [Nocardia sp. NPDC052566]|uniref:fructosamine kinase family protein n=1 Tax=Nocardia sp. NPDC052566 TaxID=3364330 RepID=UPI0037C5D879